MSRKIDLTGRKVGRWTVMHEAGHNKHRQALWECRCDCGTVRAVNRCDLRSGRSKSCGCIQAEQLGARNRTHATHGLTYTPTYRSLASAKNRCTNPHSRDYKDYGDRGIAFLFPSIGEAVIQVIAAIGRRLPGTSIDRINNDGPYALGNLRWATPSEQGRNRRPLKKRVNHV